MPERPRLRLLSLFGLSAVVLGLEVLHSRLAAYSVQNMMIYVVLGIALLGFGAAGTLVAIRQDWLTADRLPRALAWASISFCVLIVLAHALFVRLTPLLLRVDLASLGIALLLGSPFIAAGTVVTLSLSGARDTGATYASNLIGSGVGCCLPLLLLGPLDAEQLLGLFAVLAGLCAVPYVGLVEGQKRALHLSLAGALVLAASSLLLADQMFPIQRDPPPWGQLQGQYDYAAEHGIEIVERYDRWNPTGRIEIIEFRGVPGGPDPYPAMFYAQDSSAGSTLFRWDGRTKSTSRPSSTDSDSLVSPMCSETLYGQGYFAPRSRVLVIGLGGGPDLQCALYHEASEIDVVEINPDSIAAIRGPLNEWVGGIGSNPRVRFHEHDGRSFVHDSRRKFDLIQLSGVDTKNNLVSGAMALSENTLYTSEAFLDYLGSLTADGALSLIRFGEPEALRLSVTALEALRKLGVQHPERHISIVRTGVAYGVVVRRSPWTVADAETFKRQLNPPHFRGFHVYYYAQNGLPFDEPAVLEYLPPNPQPNRFAHFFGQYAAGKLSELLDHHPGDISATTDNRPFFFDIWKYDQAETWRTYHVTTIRNLIASVVLLSVVLILIPLRKLRQRGPTTGRGAMFFACIGLGFILVEVWLLHRFTMYLGHQVYSLSVVLTSLLVTTGLGAALGVRVMSDARRRAFIGCAGAVVFVTAGAFAFSPLLELSWLAPLPVRIALTVALITPLGLLLGQPFVAGLSWVRTRYPTATPWCIGINAFCSVIASVAVIPLLMAAGYSGSLIVGAGLYACAALLTQSMHAA